MTRGLFTTADDYRQPARRAEQPQEPQPVAEQPAWPQGKDAPAVFSRLKGWQPGNFPPPQDGDPPSVMAERLNSHHELWMALQRWESEQERLDQQAQAAQRVAARREQVAHAQALQEEQETQAAEQQARQLADRLQALQQAAEGQGLAVVAEGERVRLAAPPGHPAVQRLYPWEPLQQRIHIGAGVWVSRAGESLQECEQWLAQWPAELEAAEQATYPR